MSLKENIELPTPKIWKKIRNIAGIVAGVAGAAMFLPFSPAILAVIGGVAGIAAVIAGSKTFTEEDLEKLNRTELIHLRSKLLENSFGKAKGKAIDTIAMIDKQLKNYV